MSDRFVVEVDRTVAGIAVRVPGGSRFFSSQPEFRELEDRDFPRVRPMIRAVELAKRRKRKRRPQPADLLR